MFQVSRIFFFVVFICLSMVHSSYAEGTKGRALMMQPVSYRYPTGVIESDKTKYQDPLLANLWIVYSDRDDNVTYTASNGQTSFKTLKFGEAFYVLEDAGNFIHIIKFDNERGIYSSKDYKLTKDLEDFGWVRKEKMLLWGKCLVDEQTKFSIKALTVASPKSLDHISEYVKGKNLKLFNNPDISSGHENKKDVRIFDFLYIWKKDDASNSCLVSTSQYMNEATAKQAKTVLLGWVAQSVVTEWKSRVTLEKNTNSDAVQERSSKNIKITISRTPESAQQFKTSGRISKDETLDETDAFSDVRDAPEIKRLPFFTSANENVVKTGYITGILDINGHPIMSVEDQAKMQREYEKALTSFKRTNIIFVVDGSEIMKDYAAPIRDMVIKTANKIKAIEEMNADNESARVDYKIGAMVYTDYVEKDCETGQVTDFKSRPLTDHFQDIATFFQNDVNFAKCKDKDGRQSVYMGMSKALDLLKGREQESNIMIVIGAGANHVNDAKITQKDLITKLALYNCPVFAFQVKFPSVKEGDAYDDFQRQFRDIILGLANNLRDKHNKAFPDKVSQGKIEFDGIDSIPNLYKLNAPHSSPIASAFMFSDEMNAINPLKLSQAFLNMLDEFRESQEKILQASESQIKGQGERTVIDEGVLNFFTKIKVDPALLRKASFDNIQLFVEGYTPLKVDQLSQPLYRNTIFVSLDEMSSLIKELESISQVGQNKSERRANLQNALKALLEFRIGKKETKSKIRVIDIEQLMAGLSGRVTRPASIFSKVKVIDITDPKKVKEETINDFTMDIDNKVEDLRRYMNGKENQFSSNGISYFWVPEDVLP